MKSALIGYTGFVGSTLTRSFNFDALYRSTNIANIEGEKFDLLICAGAPAKKWYANQHPEEDSNSVNKLIEHLSKVEAKYFVLISTVDVFRDPTYVDELSEVEVSGLCPYGANRYRLERFVASAFDQHLIVRLPGLVGTGLKKNIIFDFLNHNQLNKIESRNCFQFYPMKNLWLDISKSRENGLNLVHLTSEPVSVNEVAREAFGIEFNNYLDRPLIKYDFRSVYADLWGKNLYQYDKNESLEAIREYALTEKRSL